MDHIICNFAFHYFMDTEGSVDNVVKIINFFLKLGGTFQLSSLNGPKIWNILKRKQEIVLKTGNIEYFKIERKYMPRRKMLNYGEMIDVYVISIGRRHSEYLLNYDYLIKKMENFIIVELTPFVEYQNDPKLMRGVILSVNERKYSEMNLFIKFRKIH